MRYLSLLLLLFAASALSAQPRAIFEEGDGPAERRLPRYTLKTDVLPWLWGFKRAANLSGDIRLSERWTTDASFGYFLNSNTFARLDGESYRGLRLRGGISFFPAPQKRSPVFFGIQLKYNNILNKTWRQLSRQGDQYAQWYLTDRRVQDYGVMFRISRRYYLGSNGRFFLDYAAGIGAVWYNVNFQKIPADATFPADDFFLFRLERPEGSGSGVDFLWQLSLGYAIW